MSSTGTGGGWSSLFAGQLIDLLCLMFVPVCGAPSEGF